MARGGHEGSQLCASEHTTHRVWLQWKVPAVAWTHAGAYQHTCAHASGHLPWGPQEGHGTEGSGPALGRTAPCALPSRCRNIGLQGNR